MKEFLVFLPITIVYLALKSTILVNLPLPDLPLIIIFYMAYRKPTIEGALMGFVLGYLDDAFNGGIIGTSSFALVLIFLAMHILAKKVQFSTPAFRAGGVAVVALIKGALTYSVLRFANVGVYFFTHVVLMSLVTGILAPGIITLFQRLFSLFGPESFKGKAN